MDIATIATFRTDRSTASIDSFRRAKLVPLSPPPSPLPSLPPPRRSAAISDEFITRRKSTGQTRYLQTTDSKLQYKQRRPKRCPANSLQANFQIKCRQHLPLPLSNVDKLIGVRVKRDVNDQGVSSVNKRSTGVSANTGYHL